MSDPRPIGVFDSGVGGLTVLREILRRTPHESTIYLGDNARAPYGVRSDEEVRRFSMEALDELAARDVKALVVACNTSTAVALRDLRPATTCRCWASSGPGAAAAALATRNRRVGVIATPATVRSHAYFNAIKDENPAVEVYEHATPRFVPMVEAGILDGAELEAAVAEDLAPLLGERDGAGEFVFPRPPSAQDRHAAARLHPLPAAAPGARRGSSATGSRSSTRRRRRRRAGRAAVGQRARGAGDDARHGRRPGRRRPRAARRRARGPATHVQLTTGDVGALPRDRDADVRGVVPGRGGRSSSGWSV